MAAVGTKEVFDQYFALLPEKTVHKSRGQVDRPEVYAYEEEMGKQIFDMDTEELLDLLLSFNNKREYGQSNYSVSLASYQQIISLYRQIWNYYIDNIEVIRNPWNDKRMRGLTVSQRIVSERKTITNNVVPQALAKINADYEGTKYADYGIYLKCLVLLFYEGFADTKEVVAFKESDINFETKEISLPRRKVKLSDECFGYLTHIHSLDMVQTLRRWTKLIPYRDGYFKISIFPGEEEGFNERDVNTVAAMLNRKLTQNVKNKYNVEITYRILYLLGFRNYVVSRCGEEHAKKIISSYKDAEDSKELVQYAKEYGFVNLNSDYIRKRMMLYK